MIFTCVSDVNGINGPSFFFRIRKCYSQTSYLVSVSREQFDDLFMRFKLPRLPKRTSDVFRHVLNADPDNHH